MSLLPYLVPGRAGGRLGPAEPFCHSVHSLQQRVLQSDCRRRPSRAIVPKDGRWELQLLGPGPRNEHRCLDSRGGDIDPTFPGRSVKEVAAICTPPGASLSSSKTEDNSCTYLTVILIIK